LIRFDSLSLLLLLVDDYFRLVSSSSSSLPDSFSLSLVIQSRNRSQFAVLRAGNKRRSKKFSERHVEDEGQQPRLDLKEGRSSVVARCNGNRAKQEYKQRARSEGKRMKRNHGQVTIKRQKERGSESKSIQSSTIRRSFLILSCRLRTLGIPLTSYATPPSASPSRNPHPHSSSSPGELYPYVSPNCNPYKSPAVNLLCHMATY
jgi:hypothetical protein